MDKIDLRESKDVPSRTPILVGPSKYIRNRERESND
jgi:hypothetical protein